MADDGIRPGTDNLLPALLLQADAGLEEAIDSLRRRPQQSAGAKQDIPYDHDR
jgi:hypothetical protein